MLIFGIFIGFLLAVLILFSFFYMFILQDGDVDKKPLFNIDFGSIKTESSSPELPLRSNHPESCEWFNFVAQKVFEEHVGDNQLKERIMTKLKEAINSGKLPSFIGKITLQDIDFGKTFPTLSKIEIKKYGENQKDIALEFMLDWKGKITIGLKTYVWINFPVKHFKSIPVSAVVSCTTLSGRARLLVPEGKNPLLEFGFISPPTTNFNVNTSIGGSVLLSNIGKIRTFILDRVKSKFERNFVVPNGMCFRIPINKIRKIKLMSIIKYNRKKLEGTVDDGYIIKKPASGNNSDNNTISNNNVVTPPQLPQKKPPQLPPKNPPTLPERKPSNKSSEIVVDKGGESDDVKGEAIHDEKSDLSEDDFVDLKESLAQSTGDENGGNVEVYEIKDDEEDEVVVDQNVHKSSPSIESSDKHEHKEDIKVEETNSTQTEHQEESKITENTNEHNSNVVKKEEANKDDHQKTQEKDNVESSSPTSHSETPTTSTTSSSSPPPLPSKVIPVLPPKTRSLEVPSSTQEQPTEHKQVSENTNKPPPLPQKNPPQLPSKRVDDHQHQTEDLHHNQTEDHTSPQQNLNAPPPLPKKSAPPLPQKSTPLPEDNGEEEYQQEEEEYQQEEEQVDQYDNNTNAPPPLPQKNAPPPLPQKNPPPLPSRNAPHSEQPEITYANEEEFVLNEEMINTFHQIKQEKLDFNQNN